MISLIFSVLGSVLVIKTIEFLRKSDNEDRLKLSVRDKGILVVIVSFFSMLMVNKYYGKIELIFYLYLTIYLIITGYIDYKTKKVYCFFNYITMIVSVIFMFKQIEVGRDITLALGSYIIYIVFSSILKMIKCYADGDNEIYIAIGYFVASAGYNDFPLYFLIINMLLSSIIVALLNIKWFNLFKQKKRKSSEKIAFAPSIAIATILSVLMI